MSSVAFILPIVCRVLDVTQSEVMASGRHRRVVLARAILWDLLRRKTTMSFPNIAKATGRVGSDGVPKHTTIITARDRLVELADCRIEDVLGENDHRAVAWRGQTVAQICWMVDVAVEAAEAKAQGDAKRRRNANESQSNLTMAGVASRTATFSPW